ncbi:hypothetical protein [Streptomyces sp. A0592]|uniref:hypothetical protein n=1 Tax=Streptomyces sp. A0592 TaxID=2563099 RepID=UPI00109E51E0|nr:hypothetical protein [Streptomyces sp. A0592]THA85614.1 hypothetical protein E6U81_06170 [Streptomyces sp. A0592]
MSAREERTALTSRTTSLYDYALFRHGIEPEGRVPRKGFPLPDGSPPPEPGRNDLTRQQAQAEVTDALTPLLADPDPVRAAQAVHRRVAELAVNRRSLRAHTARLALADEDAARRTARQLIRTGTDAAAVGVGMTLLVRLGGPEDVPCLKALGMLRGLEDAAIAALDPLDRQAAALLYIRCRDRSGELTPLTDAVATGDAETTRSALVSLTDESQAMWLGRRIAEAADLHGLLRARPQDAELLALTGRLLHRMADQLEGRADILGYLPARAVYEALVRHADRLPRTTEYRSLLLSIALDLHSGPAVLLNWRPGRRRALLDALDGLLPAAAPEPVPVPGDREADWFRRNRELPFARAEDGGRPRWEVVVVHGSADSSAVETRILADGDPLVAALFGKGRGNPPEHLLDSGRLRAAPEPREVQLAEAYCTEGCCGALYVTIRRDGDEVVWDGWRGAVGPPPPPYRFDAAAYDAELARAERDHSWCWPARSTARLIAAGLRERPELTARWELSQHWVGTDWRNPDTVVLHFRYEPSAPPPGTGGSLSFHWSLPDDDGPPRDRAAAVLRRLETDDPKAFATFGGGNAELAESLGHRTTPPAPRA